MLDSTPYVSLAQLKIYSMGADISGISDEELDFILQDAKAMADGYMQTSYEYAERTEKHPWRGDWRKRWEVFPYYAPIRTVTRFDVAVSSHSGEYSTFSVPIAAVQASMYPPEVFGDVFVDRDIGFIQTTNIMLTYGAGIAYLATAMNPLEVIISYTSGYDDGETAFPDGLSFPYPDWLVMGTLHCAAAIINERKLVKAGMGGLESAKVGARSMRRGRGADAGELDIPKAARRYLRRGILGRIGGAR